MYTKVMKISVRWMPSHLKEGDVRPDGVSELDVLGNDHADKLAGEAAKAVELSNADTCQFINYTRLVGRVQNRLATILLHLPRREHIRKARDPTVPNPTRHQLLKDTSHTIVSSGNRYTCTKCHSSFHVTDSVFKSWLQTTCIPVALQSVSDRPRPLTDIDVFHIGNKITHASHTLHIYRGLIYCCRCGARAGSNQIRKLAKVCETAASGSPGRLVIDRINAGRKPSGVLKWPDEL
jgi:hypothetical protein